MVANVEGERGNTGIGEWQAQNIVYKTGYGNVLYNTQNIANILIITVNGMKPLKLF